jgi:hypothetical protein
MAGKQEENLERLVQFYQDTVSQVIDSAQTNKPQMSENVLRDKEFQLAGANQLVPEDVNAVLGYRRKALLGLMYDKLKTLKDQGTLDGIVSKVRDPMLDGAMIWLGMNGGLENISRQRFEEEYDARIGVYARRLPTFIRPLALLDMVKQDPSLVSKLEDSSSYFPESLIDRPVKRTIKDAESEFAEIIPTIVSEDLARLVKKMDKYIEHKTGSNRYEARVGRYALPSERFAWKETGPLVEQKMYSLFSDYSVRKELYETLAEYITMAQAIGRKEGRNMRRLGHKSDLFLSNAEYARIRDGIKMYARNQILWAWKESGCKYAPQTVLSKFAGLTPQMEDNQLLIHDINRRSTEILSQDSRYVDTQKYLPYFTAVLGRAYKGSTSL